ncbi:MAG: hypothetical protein OEV78_10545 [Spirochaetia bacterium]|nr:hypothetical protein [Spirochaetia bacterium]
MEIKIDNKQYEKLLKLIYMGMWVVEAYDQGNDNYFTEVEQMIYSKSSEIANQNLIEFDEASNKYFPALNFDKDDIIIKYIDGYEENIFWDELIDRLTKRDMIKKHTLDGIQKMTQAQVFEYENEFIEKYEKEFQEKGIENLGII